MTGHRSRSRAHLLWLLVMVLALVAAACGGDDSDTEAASDDDAPEDSSSTTEAPETTEAPASTEAPEATEAPSTTEATTTTAAPGPWEPYEDGENDCQRNSDYAAAPMCMPPDIDTVTITRASPLTIVTTFRAPVVTIDWQLTIGFDLDNDATTGITDGIWSEFHGIGPDLEIDYFADNAGAPFAQINEIEPGPVFTLLEAGPPDQGPLAVWTWTDDQTLEVVISDEAIPDAASGFPVAGQTMHPDYHDAIPDEGPLPWP